MPCGRPMLATLTTSYFSDTGWLLEGKLDGVRTLAVRAGHGTRLYSRNHKPMNAPYPEIAEALDAQAPDGMVADGEIVAFDGDQTSFSTLQARIGLSDPNRAQATAVPVILYLFDLLVLDGYDLTGLPLRERTRLLSEAVEFEDPIRFSEHRHTDGQAYLKQACAPGREGLIANAPTSPTSDPDLRPDRWTIHTTLVRLHDTGDPLAPLIGQHQDLPPLQSGAVNEDLWKSAPGRIAEGPRELGFRSMVASPIIVEGRLWGLVAAIVAGVLASLVAVIVRNLSRSKLGCRPASPRCGASGVFRRATGLSAGMLADTARVVDAERLTVRGDADVRVARVARTRHGRNSGYLCPAA
jgi:hypothetical protein